MATDTAVDVRALVEQGVSLRNAVVAALDSRGHTMASWCRATGYAQSYLSRMLSRSQRYESLRVALCRALDIDKAWLDEQLR